MVILLSIAITVISILLIFIYKKNTKHTKNNLLKSEEKLRVIFEYANDAIFLFSLTEDLMPSKYIDVNQTACNLLGYKKEELLTLSPLQLTPKERWDKIPLIVKKLFSKGQLTFEGEYIAKNGNPIPFEFSVCTLNLGDEKVVMSIGRDITERKKSEAMIKKMAYQDHLTNLPNRRLFEEKLQHEIYIAKLNNQTIAVLFLDLDGFKEINDTYGHDLGDVLLQEVAHRLTTCVFNKGVVARYAGDEFTVMFTEITKEEAIVNAQRILSDFEQAFSLNGTHIHVTPSIGISFYPEDGLNVKELIMQADAYMYKAKRNGKNNYCLYEVEKQVVHS